MAKLATPMAPSVTRVALTMLRIFISEVSVAFTATIVHRPTYGGNTCPKYRGRTTEWKTRLWAKVSEWVVLYRASGTEVTVLWKTLVIPVSVGNVRLTAIPI